MDNTYICKLCPRQCNAVRSESDNVGGFCGMPYALFAARAAKHMWEEPCISGTRGSGTVFFSGCQLKCCYCQNAAISRDAFGAKISPRDLSEIFKRLEAEGVHNINLVSPTPYVPLIIEAFEIYKPKLPVVYNSGGYESAETLQMLNDIVDIYLLDFKYSDSKTAALYSAASDYPAVAKETVRIAHDSVGDVRLDGDRIMQSGVIVRHLLLPFGTREAAEVINTVKNMNIDILFSLMGQYTPLGGESLGKLNRKVTKREYLKAVTAFEESGLSGYVQDLESADEGYIPEFDLTGILPCTE